MGGGRPHFTLEKRGCCSTLLEKEKLFSPFLISPRSLRLIIGSFEGAADGWTTRDVVKRERRANDAGSTLGIVHREDAIGKGPSIDAGDVIVVAVPRTPTREAPAVPAAARMRESLLSRCSTSSSSNIDNGHVNAPPLPPPPEDEDSLQVRLEEDALDEARVEPFPRSFRRNRRGFEGNPEENLLQRRGKQGYH